MTLTLILEILGTVIGIVYLYLEYKASKWLWLANFLMPALSLMVFYEAGLYADLWINIYYMLAAVYGYVVWTCAKPSDGDPGELPITHMPRGSYVKASLVGAVLLMLLYWVLDRFTDSTVAFVDALTTALSVVAMWMLARKYLQQWLVWIAVDAISVALYVYKGIYFYAALYFVYTIVAVAGYYNWKKMMKHGN